MEAWPRDPQMNLLWTARMDYRQGRWIKLHRHTVYYQLLIMLSGQGELHFGENAVQMQPGNYYFIRRHREHSFLYKTDSTTLDFKFNVSDKKLAALIDNHPICAPCAEEEMANLKSCFRLSLTNLRNPEPILPGLIDTMFKAILLTMVRIQKRPPNGLHTPSISGHADFPIARYIQDHHAEPLTVSVLAKQFNFHPHYLIKLFKDKTGLTPNRFLQLVRLNKARELLEFSSLSVEQIAESVGWSLPYFSKIFQTHERISPSRFRQFTRTAIGTDIVLEQDFQH